MEHYGEPLPPPEYGPAFTAGERVLIIFRVRCAVACLRWCEEFYRVALAWICDLTCCTVLSYCTVIYSQFEDNTITDTITVYAPSLYSHARSREPCSWWRHSGLSGLSGAFGAVGAVRSFRGCWGCPELSRLLGLLWAVIGE